MGRTRAILRIRVLLRLTDKLSPATVRTSRALLHRRLLIKAMAARRATPANSHKGIRKYRDESLAFSTCRVMYPRSPAV